MSSHWRARNFWSNQGAKWKDSDCLQVDMSKKVHRKPRCGKLPPLCYFSISLKCELNVNISILQVVIIEEKNSRSVLDKRIMNHGLPFYIYLYWWFPLIESPNISDQTTIFNLDHIFGKVPVALSTSEPCQVPKTSSTHQLPKVFVLKDQSPPTSNTLHLLPSKISNSL